MPVEVPPPATEVGDTDRLVREGSAIVKLVVCEELPNVAVRVTVSVAETGDVVIVMFALLELWGIDTVAGSWASVLLLCSETVTPPGAAMPDREIEPATDCPPITLGWAMERLETAGVAPTVKPASTREVCHCEYSAAGLVELADH